MTARERATRHEQGLARDERRQRGVFYTPAALVDRVLDLVLDPVLDEVADPLSLRVLDPACGAGVFLAAAAERIAARAGVPIEQAHGCLVGIDLDAAAVDVARACLPGADLVVGNGLLAPVEPVDVVVGNPPFLSQLRKATAMSREDVAEVRRLLGDLVRPYTDISALFLAHSTQVVRPGGRVGLVQPLSVLAARDAAPVRDHLEQHGSVDLWASPEPEFADASVFTCVVAFRRGQPSVRARVRSSPTWGPLAAAAFGIPLGISLDTPLGDPAVGGGVLGDLGEVTADFRDQYYGLREHLADGGPGFPLITTGLIEPGRCEWGRRDARIFKQRWQRPTVRADVLAGPLGEWARKRLVPKVLIGTQGRIIEAVADEAGEWLPSVPVISLATDRPWHALAVLHAPPVVAHAAATWLGSGLSPASIKLSARQVAALPLPADEAGWDRAAELARAGEVADCARVMTSAYGAGQDVLGWWEERARLCR